MRPVKSTTENCREMRLVKAMMMADKKIQEIRQDNAQRRVLVEERPAKRERDRTPNWNACRCCSRASSCTLPQNPGQSSLKGRFGRFLHTVNR